ncbi:MAG: aminoacyl--tRNA ligase-related protein [bacterium]|nr:aminoacyl--tRNA ligase-related protein [bacterium]
MRYSKLFGKTIKEPQSDMKAASHRLLHQAGFVRESTAGRYFFLPLGNLVRNKIISIIREEMNKSGAQEMISPVLHPLELWKETNRTNTAGFELMKIKDRRGAEFALGGTAEEMFVDVVRKFQISYRDLPFNIYQFSQKFRDELRARGGLLRVREFLMKDAYSFHTNEEDFKREYLNMWDTYSCIYKRVGLDTIVVESDNGYIGGEYCHEFVVESEAGESKFFISEDGKYAAHEDVVDKNKYKGKLIEKLGIEVGNIFQLGYHYSNKMANATFTGEDGSPQKYYMGCYGIGIGRTLATIVETHHDDKGIIWPDAVAPFQIYLINLNKDSFKADELYKVLQGQVLYDDRKDVSAGAKFADADLIGIPVRLVISERTGDKIEYKRRASTQTELLTIAQFMQKINR